MRSVLVLGLGKSGIAAARHALGAGDELVIYAGASNESTRPRRREFERAGVPVIFDVEEVEGHFDTCVVSPGISERGAFYASAGKASGEVISEPEYAWRMSPRAWVAVTGTNGKDDDHLSHDASTQRVRQARPCVRKHRRDLRRSCRV